ncbi:MAG: Lrp/AsnC family transcriptional regulator [Armatimonadetes bacterium]|nr:Lrp/AsnC family transcriptional regulator [Armatimonadota bacterium]
MDDIDKRLLNLLQNDFPLTSEPFAGLGRELDISEDEVISRIGAVKERGIVRQISAIFDSGKLGYQSSLAAFSVPEERVEEVAAIVSAHPGVSHNYERRHAYNLWFTITVPPGIRLVDEVNNLAERSKIESVRLFPTIRLFKIGVAFDMLGGNAAAVPNGPQVAKKPLALNEEDIKAVRALQQNLPLRRRPFAVLAKEAGMSEEELLSRARAFLEAGAMRRFAAVLRHREAGFAANAMTAWRVPEDRIEEVGTTMAAHRGVSHCYQRPTYPDWPYSIFTMIHARTHEDCEKTARELSTAAGIADYVLLYSTREFKKARVQYYEHGEVSD